MKRATLCCLALLLAAPAMAAEKPPEIGSYIHASAPYGAGALKRLWFKAYDASLWTDAKKWSMDKPFALSMQYDVRLDSDDLVDATLDEMRRLSKQHEDFRAAYGEKLHTLLPAVKQGDIITALFLPKKGTLFFFNGKPTGSIAGRGFAELFFGIWFSDNTAEPSLRKALLHDHAE